MNNPLDLPWSLLHYLRQQVNLQSKFTTVSADDDEWRDGRLPGETTTCLTNLPAEPRAARSAPQWPSPRPASSAPPSHSPAARAAAATAPRSITFHMSKPEAIPYFRDLIDEFNASQNDVEVILDTASNLSGRLPPRQSAGPRAAELQHGDGALHGARRAQRPLRHARGRPHPARGAGARRPVRDVPGAHERAAVLGDGGIRHLQQADLRGERPRGARPPGTSSSRSARRSRLPAITPIYATFKDAVDGGAGAVRLHRRRHGRRRRLLRAR